MFHGLFDAIEIYVNNIQVCRSNAFYPYRGFLYRLLSCSSEQKSTGLQAEFWHPDSTSNTFNLTGNTGFKVRYDLSRKELFLHRYICDGFLNQKRLLLPNTDLGIKLKRSNPAFYLDGTGAQTNNNLNAKLQITNASFNVRKEIVAPEVAQIHQQQLTRNTRFHYPFKNIDNKTFTVAQRSTSHVSESLFQSRLPQTVIVGLVEAEAFVGHVQKSPFCFEPHSISNVAITINSETVIHRSTDFDFSIKKFWKGNIDLCSLLGPYRSHGISPERYKKDQFFAVFSLGSMLGNRLNV